MSVLDIVVRDAAALIGVDTSFANQAAGGRQVHGPKCLALPHARACRRPW
jgi:hypothetical protein